MKLKHLGAVKGSGKRIIDKMMKPGEQLVVYFSRLSEDK